jgi:preprotein translocase subunit SecG
MDLFVVALHIILCLILILIILLQPGKGGDVGAAFGGGGGGGSMFGPRGPASLLSRVTTGSAVLFMVTSMVLAYKANRGRDGTGYGEANGDAEQQIFGQPEADEEAPPVEEPVPERDVPEAP